MKSLIVSLHDAHPGSLRQIMEQRQALQEWGVSSCSILAVPHFHHEIPLVDCPASVAWLTQQQEAGDELVLHGYYHDRAGQTDTLTNLFWTRFYTNHEAEFLDFSSEEADRRLRMGQQLFREKNWSAAGFIAPAWLMAPHLPETLRRLGFVYTNTVRGLWPLQADRPFIPAQSLCWSVRAVWRRQASLLWNARLFRQLRQQALLRISLHPHDFHYPAIRRQIEHCVRASLQAGYQPVSYGQFLTA